MTKPTLKRELLDLENQYRQAISGLTKLSLQYRFAARWTWAVSRQWRAGIPAPQPGRN